MWSVITSVGCNHYGSLEFEKYWAGRGCQITLYTYSALKTQAAGECEYETESKKAEGIARVPGHPNLVINRNALWASNAYSAFYKHLGENVPALDVFKVQMREGVGEDLDGVQFTVLSDLYLHKRAFASKIRRLLNDTRRCHQIKGHVPAYCKIPTVADEAEIQRWIRRELGLRCHQTQLAV